MFVDPYDDEEYHKTLRIPRNPPNLNDLIAGRVTIRQSIPHEEEEDRRTTKKLKQSYRNDKTIPIQQKASFISKDSSIHIDSWQKITNIVLQQAKENDIHKYSIKNLNEKLLDAKIKISKLDPQKLLNARRLANPYELVGNSIFINRAAVKLANLDAIYSLIPVSPKKFMYADLCSGPGGFTEYIYWKLSKDQSSQCHGWGITLRGNQDYSLEKMVVKPQGFKPVYGDGTGDLYNLGNVEAFVQQVLKESFSKSKESTESDGVHLVLGDGGFSVLGDEQYVEHHSRQLIVAQILTMFSILKQGGNFVLKVFDILTDFSVELVYLLYLHFEKISIIKPFSSRAANSERYLVCLNLQKQRPKELIEFLSKVLLSFNKLKPSSSHAPKSGHSTHQPGFVKRQEMIDLGLLEVNDILDINEILKDENFIDAITGSNMKLAVKQKEALEEIYNYALGKQELRWDQKEVAKSCCKEWKIPYQEGT